MPRAMGKLERLSYERHERDLELCKRKGGHPRGLKFDEAAGQRVITFIEKYCRHHKGEWSGRPLILEPWQKSILLSAFGWIRADGTRRFRTMYMEVARKNGKSELAGALGLYLLLGDHEPGAEVYSTATKKDQARIVWKTAAEMVKKSPELKRFIKCYQSSLVVERNSSSFQPLSAESNTLDGLNPHGNIVDELHAHRDRGVWDVLDSAMGSRRQPMTIAITTAGIYDQDGIGWTMHDYAQKVLEQTFDDDDFFAFIAAPDEGDKPFDETTQQKANPNWGVSVKLDYMAKQAVKAQRQTGFFNEYTTKHLNSWTQQVKRWLNMEKWNACEPATPPLANARELAIVREKLLNGRICRGGLDLSSKLDLTAFVLEFENDSNEIELICRFWLPESRVDETLKKGQRFYETWVREGWLKTTPGDVIDYEFIRAEINELSETYKIKEIAFDPWNAVDIATRLTGDGITMVEVRQGYRTLSEPSKDIEARIIQGKVRHHNDPILRWNAANAVVITDPTGSIKPDKAKATEKIDGIAAWVMARSRSIVAIETDESPYSGSRGFLSL